MSAMETYKKAYMDGFSGRKEPDHSKAHPYGMVSLGGYLEGSMRRRMLTGGFNVPSS